MGCLGVGLVAILVLGPILRVEGDPEVKRPRTNREQLEAIAKKHGFASYDEYNVVIDNISLVLGAIDPVSKKYVGSEAVIKGQIAQVEADKKMSAEDRQQALNDLNLALKMPAPVIENKGNIDLVIKYYDKLDAVMGEDQN